MKAKYLFPSKFKRIGWIILIPAAILGCMVLFGDFEFDCLNVKVLALLPNGQSSLASIISNNITNELAGIFFILGAMMVAFAEEKNEDEYISKIRLESLLWATYCSFAIQIFSLLFFYDFTFLMAMVINIFTILIVFIIRFNFLLFKLKNEKDEK